MICPSPKLLRSSKARHDQREYPLRACRGTYVRALSNPDACTVLCEVESSSNIIIAYNQSKGGRTKESFCQGTPSNAAEK